ncbi:MAG: hypothetical protein N3A54_01125 [Patescibacteria group bacterium]|nr:hypothetical protein [Patescibacteria group bacterium]
MSVINLDLESYKDNNIVVLMVFDSSPPIKLKLVNEKSAKAILMFFLEGTPLPDIDEMMKYENCFFFSSSNLNFFNFNNEKLPIIIQEICTSLDLDLEKSRLSYILIMNGKIDVAPSSNVDYIINYCKKLGFYGEGRVGGEGGEEKEKIEGAEPERLKKFNDFSS